MKKISDRLEMLVGLCGKCRSLADIGCDHALASLRLAEDGKAEKIYACDLREGPLERAKNNIAEAGMSDRIETILSDGLLGIPADVESILIAGMGGILICRILDRGKDKLKHCKSIVVSPHSDRSLVRKKLLDLGYDIKKEADCFDDGKYYQGIYAEKQQPENDYEIWELEFGRMLIREKSPELKKYLHQRLDKFENIIESMKDRSGELPEALVLEKTMIENALKAMR